ncbi:hypothetical protein TH61_03540 [Rufibacter sp. DG15C]|uniref:hypothetical protein n=1 Tax=Rufibacter sp. DG15C TaxID=1379909 RepID=UPI00078DDF33|nr:hypothetical protein [Rufibacter sp. DG15C]AMM50443.1 hypothetical protein TH61_03540 [Rufibacter sp. DG15C]
MDTLRRFSGTSEEELWRQLTIDLARDKNLTSYSAQLMLNDTEVFLDIDIDLGGGFEGGSSSTTFMAPVPTNVPLRFALHEQDWMSEIGKFFGMGDVQLNLPDLDDAFVIKANDPVALASLLSDAKVRQTLLEHSNCELKLSVDNDEPDATPFLTFSKDDAILDMDKLQEVYRMILKLLQKLNPPVATTTEFDKL